jgi:hypothetical protein
VWCAKLLCTYLARPADPALIKTALHQVSHGNPGCGQARSTTDGWVGVGYRQSGRTAVDGQYRPVGVRVKIAPEQTLKRKDTAASNGELRSSGTKTRSRSFGPEGRLAAPIDEPRGPYADPVVFDNCLAKALMQFLTDEPSNGIS